MISSASVSISSLLSYLSANSADSTKSTVYCADDADPTIVSPATKVPFVVPSFNVFVITFQDLTLAVALETEPVTSSLN